MADEFDAQVEAQSLASLVKTTSDAVRPVVPPSTPSPLFRTLEDGSVVNRNGTVLRGPIAPLEKKV